MFFNVYYIICKNFFTSKLQLLYLFILNINNFWWNYLFIFLIICLFYYNKRVNIIISYFIFQVISYKVNLKFIPTTLYIGYNNIHPPLFYFSLIIGISYFLYNRWINIKLSTIFIFSFITLMLGGLWGLGNSVWGFFWVNDKIELVLLLYILVLLFILHTFKKTINIKKIYAAIFCLLLILLSFRYGFAFTRHSFFDLKNMCNNIKYLLIFFNILNVNFFLLLIILLISYYTIFLTFLYYLYKNYNVNYKFTLYTLHVLIILFIITWLKFKINNLSYYVIVKYIATTSQLYFKKNFIIKNLLILKKIKLLNINYSMFFLYNLKVVKTFWIIYTSYISSLLIFIVLISIIRFIVK